MLEVVSAVDEKKNWGRAVNPDRSPAAPLFMGILTQLWALPTLQIRLSVLCKMCLGSGSRKETILGSAERHCVFVRLPCKARVHLNNQCIKIAVLDSPHSREESLYSLCKGCGDYVTCPEPQGKSRTIPGAKSAPPGSLGLMPYCHIHCPRASSLSHESII